MKPLQTTLCLDESCWFFFSPFFFFVKQIWNKKCNFHSGACMKWSGLQNSCPGWMCLRWASKQYSCNSSKSTHCWGAHGRVGCYWFFFNLFYVNPSFLLIENTNKKKKGKGGREGGRQKKKNREFCSVSPIKSIHPDEGFNGANPLLESKRNSPLWLSHDGGRRESRNERGADLSPRFSCLVPFMCALPPPPPPSLLLCLSSHWNVKCSSCLGVKEGFPGGNGLPF